MNANQLSPQNPELVETHCRASLLPCVSIAVRLYCHAVHPDIPLTHFICPAYIGSIAVALTKSKHLR